MFFRWKLLVLSAALALPTAHATDTDTATDTDVAAGSDAATEPDIVISAGRKDLGYWGIASRLRQAATEYSLGIDLRESVGASENLQRLGDPESPVGLALTQTDALRHYLDQNPGFLTELQIFESIGQECVFIITAANSGITNQSDLEKKDAGHRLAIQSPDSGSAVTFAVMQGLKPELGNTEIVYMDTMAAMEKLADADARQADALMLVHRPKTRSPELKRALAEPQTFHLVTLDDPALQGKLPNGNPVYTPLDVPLIRTGWKVERSIKTLCTDGLLVGSTSKLSAPDTDTLNRVIELHWMNIYHEE